MFDYSQPASFQWNELKRIFSMKNYSWAIALISFIISVCALVTSCRIEPFHVGIESVMGIVTALMGICATFMVGWQIFSSLNVNKELENLKLTNDEFKKKVEKLDNLIEKQKEEIAKEKEARSLMKKEMDAQLLLTKAISFFEIEVLSSYELFAKSLYYFLEVLNYERIDTILDNMSATLGYGKIILQSIKAKEGKYDIELLDYNNKTSLDTEECPTKALAFSPNYPIIKDRIEKLEESRLKLSKEIKEFRESE